MGNTTSNTQSPRKVSLGEELGDVSHRSQIQKEEALYYKELEEIIPLSNKIDDYIKDNESVFMATALKGDFTKCFTIDNPIKNNPDYQNIIDKYVKTKPCKNGLDIDSIKIKEDNLEVCVHWTYVYRNMND